MPALFACRPLARPEEIPSLRADYLRTLVAPVDGMWEGAVIAQAAWWEIYEDEHQVGFFCLDADQTLLRFHLLDDYQSRAQAIFRWLVATRHIQRAIAGTNEPAYLSLCLDMQRAITPHSYLFRDSRVAEPEPGLTPDSFAMADREEFAAFANFYRENVAGTGEWVEPFLRERLARGELFGLFDRQRIVAAGECIPSPSQPPFADLGMVVAQAERGRGLGTAMLGYLKQHCYALGYRPICSCAADNAASKRAIEKAGFISEHRLVTILF
jgi:RimJ/RimL family protein N-acetyltransferase